MKIVAKKLWESEETTDKLFNFRPVFFAAIFLCLGIVFAYKRVIEGISSLWALGLLPFAILPFFFARTRSRMEKTALSILALAIFFLLGQSVFLVKCSSFTNVERMDSYTTVIGRVVEKNEFGSTVRVVLTDLSIGEKSTKGKLNAYLPASFCKNVRLSDKLLLEGRAQTDVALTNERGFRATDIKENVVYQLTEIEKCVVVGHKIDVFLEVKERMKTVLYAGMSEESAAISYATLLGDVSGIEGGLLENVRVGGVAHVFAVSGLHIGSLFAFCMLIINKTNLKNTSKILRFLLTAATLIFYSGVCGFSSSALRATVICLVMYGAKLIGTTSDFLERIGLAAVLILLFSPTLLFEIGFQLSFAACLGLAFLTRPFTKALQMLSGAIVKLFQKEGKARPNPKRKGDTSPLTIPQRALRSTISFLSASLAAQVATAPILLRAFGYLSGASLILNCIFVPFISVGFSVLLLFVACACLLPTAFSSVLLYLPSVVWSSLTLVFHAVDFSAFALTGIRISGGSMICYYGGGLFLSDKWNVRRKEKYFLVLVCFVAFGITMYALNV